MQESRFDLFYKSSGICTDTRRITRDCLFICIKGDNFNGNTFAKEALKIGASHVIVDDPEYYEEEGKMTLVNNSVQFLQELANYHRRKYEIPVIGITGSNGKTTTKELMNSVLSKKYNVLATEGNLNNHLGVPFTLLRLNDKHDIAIIEMGANKPKDIEELCAIAEPTHGIITNIGKAHLEGFVNFEGVLKTKTELYTSVKNNGGTIIYNMDDAILKANLPEETTCIGYGENKDAVIKGKLVNLSPFVEMIWSHEDFSSEVLMMKMIGKYNYYNYLAAICFGHLFRVDSNAISEALIEYTPTNNRSQVSKTDKNTLILDCYNANPTSMKSALESFQMNPAPSKIAILGDMKELGKNSSAEHQLIGEVLDSLDIEAITVGDEFMKVQSSSIKTRFNTTNEFIEYLKTCPIKDKLLLLKGSRSVGLENLEKWL